jgi:hypothetical protein
MEMSEEQIVEAYHFFFFINTKSGNREGQLIMSYKTATFPQDATNAPEVKFSYIDLFDSENRMS